MVYNLGLRVAASLAEFCRVAGKVILWGQSTGVLAVPCLSIIGFRV